MDLNSTFATNVCIHAFKEMTAPLSFLTETFFLSFLTVGAGFALSKANVFPTEASRGVAQIVMVRRLTTGTAAYYYVFVMGCGAAHQIYFL
jgi:hypothetical protein